MKVLTAIIGILVILLGLFLIYFTNRKIERSDRRIKLFLGAGLLILLGIYVISDGIESLI